MLLISLWRLNVEASCITSNYYVVISWGVDALKKKLLQILLYTYKWKCRQQQKSDVENMKRGCEQISDNSNEIFHSESNFAIGTYKQW